MASESGVTVAKQQESSINLQALEDKTLIDSIDTLRTIFQTCYGPNGKTKLLHNNTGGHVTVTSSCCRLLSGLSGTSPVLKLVISALQGYATKYEDGGLFTAVFALNLLQNSLTLDLHPRLIADINQLILKHCLLFLQSDSSNCKVKVGFAELETLKRLIRTVLSTKRGCGLSILDTEHIVSIVLESFLLSFKSNCSTSDIFGQVQYLLVEGQHVSESKIVNGLMFQVPEIPTYTSHPVLSNKQLKSYKVALFNISMAGDSENFIEADAYEMDASIDVNDSVIEAMLKCCKSLKEAGVNVLACQKVIHPSIKKYLKNNGILVIERLSVNYIYGFQSLAGGEILSSFKPAISEDFFGYLENVSHVVIKGKSYLHLQNAKKPVCTVILSNKTEESLNEMKSVCSAACQVLRLLLNEPFALLGGGCWQFHLAQWIRSSCYLAILDPDLEEIGCSKQQLRTILENFASTLEQVAMAIHKDSFTEYMIDTSFHHLWVEKEGLEPYLQDQMKEKICVCGMYRNNGDLQFKYVSEKSSETGTKFETMATEQPTVLDSYVTGVYGFQLGVSIAGMVLQIQHTICDTN